MMFFEQTAGPELERWVAIAEGLRVEKRVDPSSDQVNFCVIGENGEQPVPAYSTDEQLARAIIEPEGIEIRWHIDHEWDQPEMAGATIARSAGSNGERPPKPTPFLGETEIAAAMLCYVNFTFGYIPRAGEMPESR
jgi:hypothetical protein